MEFDMLPTTRAEWETSWPDRASRYLAWCNTVRHSPADRQIGGYSAWINERMDAFRGRTTAGFGTPEFDEAFDAFLWGEL